MALKHFVAAKPGWTILALAAIILLSEAIIMVFLGQGQGLTWASSLRIVVLDAGTLTALLVPFIYLVFIKPARRLEEGYRVLVESVPDAVFHLDRDGRILYVNGRMEALTGFTRAELTGRLYLDVVSPQALPGMQRAFASLREGATLRSEASVLMTSGDEQVFVEFSAVPRLDQGRFQGAVGILRDVTERRQIEERLFRVQQDWEGAFDSLTDMVTVHDKDFNIIRANKAAEKILTLPILEGGAAKCFRYYHGTQCPPEACPSCQALGTGLPSVNEIYEPHLGRYLEIRAIPRFDRERRVVGLIHVVRDISEKKQAEAALRESEQQYRRLFEGNPQPMWVYDVETLGFLAVNDAAVSHYGFSREEFRGMTIKDIRPAEDVPSLVASVAKRDRGATRARDVRHRKKDGTIIFVDITSYPMVFAGRPARIVLANDVTEHRRLEEQLRHAQKMEAVGQLAGGVAHDFNNMLTVIVMYATVLQEALRGDPTLQAHVDQILKSAERAATLTRSLLTFSRKNVAAKLQPVDLNEVIQSVAKLLRRVLGEQIEIRTHLRGQKLVVMADDGQLEQVIMNLCTNARDAMPGGGILTIETAAEEIGSGFTAAHGYGRIGTYATFTVADTGEGMDEATRQRVFEPFFTTKDIGKGTGLGLAIVYGIVKQHEGFIDVTSRVGTGTAFKVYLPLIAKESLVSEDPGRPAPPSGTELVLLAEDEEDVRRITRAVLEGHGYRVLEAVDGEDAVRKFRESKERISLLLSDNIMPGKSGKDAYEEMRRTDPALKVIFMSGYSADFLEQEGISGDAGSLLAKPVSPVDLLRRIREVLDKT